jgi:hypothetical protein
LLTAFMIAAQQSSLLLSLVLLAVLLPVARMLGRRPGTLPLLPPALAVLALLTVNLAGHHRLSLSPYGNIFVLSRVIYDGPGMAVLRRDCPAAGWRLCRVLDHMPPTSDEFLWRADSPIVLAGGHKTVSAEADAIIAAAWRAEPLTEALAILANAWEQLHLFASGDGLEPWPNQVDPWISRDFPATATAAYMAARQQRGALSVPEPLAVIHRLVALLGIALAATLLPLAWRRRHCAAGFLAAALITLPASALITGGLSTPHDRYQARVMWLPACIVLLSAPALLRRRL